MELIDKISSHPLEILDKIPNTWNLDLDITNKIYMKFCDLGYEVKDYDSEFKVSRVKIPKGDIFSRRDINRILEGKLVIGNTKQIEAFKAERFMDFCNYYGH